MKTQQVAAARQSQITTQAQTAPAGPESILQKVFGSSQLTLNQKFDALAELETCKELDAKDPKGLMMQLSMILDLTCELIGILPAYRPSIPAGKVILFEYKNTYGHLTPMHLLHAFKRACKGTYGDKYTEAYQSFDLSLMHGVMQAYQAEWGLARDSRSDRNSSLEDKYLAAIDSVKERSKKASDHVFAVMEDCFNKVESDGDYSYSYMNLWMVYEPVVEFLIHIGLDANGLRPVTDDSREHLMNLAVKESNRMITELYDQNDLNVVAARLGTLAKQPLDQDSELLRGNYYKCRLINWARIHKNFGKSDNSLIQKMKENYCYVDLNLRLELLKNQDFINYHIKQAE